MNAPKRKSARLCESSCSWPWDCVDIHKQMSAHWQCHLPPPPSPLPPTHLALTSSLTSLDSERSLDPERSAAAAVQGGERSSCIASYANVRDCAQFKLQLIPAPP